MMGKRIGVLLDDAEQAAIEEAARRQGIRVCAHARL